MASGRIRVKLASLCVLLAVGVLAPEARAGDGDVRRQVRTYLEREEVRPVFSPVMKTMLQAQAAVKPLNGLYAALLLGSPDFAKAAAEGGLAGLAKETAKKTVFKLAKDVLSHPSRAARKVADAEYAAGQAAYKRNYDLFKRLQKGADLTEREARRFVVDQEKVFRMIAAVQMIREVNSREYDDWEDPVFKGKREAAKSALGKVAEFEGSGAVAALEVVDVLVTLRRIVDSSGVSLGDYPPYRKFLQTVESYAKGLEAVLEAGQQPEPEASEPDVTLTITIEVDGRKPNGFHWDPLGNRPDIAGTFVTPNGRVIRVPLAQDSFSTKFTARSVRHSRGDKIEISLHDQDLKYHDPIGSGTVRFEGPGRISIRLGSARIIIEASR